MMENEMETVIGFKAPFQSGTRISLSPRLLNVRAFFMFSLSSLYCFSDERLGKKQYETQ